MMSFLNFNSKTHNNETQSFMHYQQGNVMTIYFASDQLNVASRTLSCVKEAGHDVVDLRPRKQHRLIIRFWCKACDGVTAG